MNAEMSFEVEFIWEHESLSQILTKSLISNASFYGSRRRPLWGLF